MLIKIIGAGSVGNHYAHACRRIGWDVDITDVSGEALRRTKEFIYPSRYGKWDDAIRLLLPDDNMHDRLYDIVFIGTPPDTHLGLMQDELSKDNPKILHIEKPLFPPEEENIEAAVCVAQRFPDTYITVGYNHTVAASVTAVSELLRKGVIGKPLTMDVEAREQWQGIFNAHPWLSGPQDSYLGYWRRGGGASGEHSHALNLWQHFAHVMGWGKVSYVSANMEMHSEDGTDYDALTSLFLRTNNGRCGRVIQDVLTIPAQKWAKIQGDSGFVEWHCDGANGKGDLVRYANAQHESVIERVFRKRRPDDFYQVVVHYKRLLEHTIAFCDSPMRFMRGIETMRVLTQAHRVHLWASV